MELSSSRHHFLYRQTKEENIARKEIELRGLRRSYFIVWLAILRLYGALWLVGFWSGIYQENGPFLYVFFRLPGKTETQKVFKKAEFNFFLHNSTILASGI